MSELLNHGLNVNSIVIVAYMALFESMWYLLLFNNFYRIFKIPFKQVV